METNFEVVSRLQERIFPGDKRAIFTEERLDRIMDALDSRRWIFAGVVFALAVVVLVRVWLRILI